jgi:hypothetical protein
VYHSQLQEKITLDLLCAAAAGTWNEADVLCCPVQPDGLHAIDCGQLLMLCVAPERYY